MAHGHVGSNTVRRQQSRGGCVDGDDRGLRDGGLTEIVVGFLYGGGVGWIDKHHFTERLAQQWRHHAIGLGKCLRDDRLGLAKAVHHVYVLRALAGIEERYLGSEAVSPEDTLRA